MAGAIVDTISVIASPRIVFPLESTYLYDLAVVINKENKIFV